MRITASRAATRPIVVVAWLLVGVIAVLLTLERFRDAVASGLGPDLSIFVRAAELARNGGDVYDATGYTYSPLVAWLLAPLVGGDHVMAVWSAISLAAGLGSVALVTMTHWHRLPGWRAPLVAGIAVVTLLYSEVLSIELFFGQTQLVIVALLALAVLVGTRWPALSGVVLAVAALVKTWPIVFGIWLIRARARTPVVAVVSAIVTLAVFAIVMGSVTGAEGIARWVQRTFEMGQQPWDVYSVWFFARQAFAEGEDAVALSAAPVGGLMVSGSLALVVVALVALTLVRPGTTSLAMWNLAGGVILLLPVSHPFYRLVMLPLIWVWTVELISARRKRPAIIALAVLVVWWIVSFRTAASVDTDGWIQFAVVCTTLVGFGVSTLLAASLDPGRSRPIFGRQTRKGHETDGEPAVAPQPAEVLRRSP